MTPEEVNQFVAEAFPASAGGGFSCEEIGEGWALGRWRYDPAVLRPGAFISGMTQFGLADATLWFAVFTAIGMEAMAVTSHLNISFLRPAQGGDLLARAELLRVGKTLISGDIRLWVEGDPHRPVSHAAGSYARPR